MFMSRSYKHYPCYKRTTKGMKEIASRCVRRKINDIFYDVGDYSFYKKMWCSYDICDYKFVKTYAEIKKKFMSALKHFMQTGEESFYIENGYEYRYYCKFYKWK